MGHPFLDCAKVRTMRATELKLPLSPVECPFEQLPDSAIVHTAKLLADFPEKRGRLSEAIAIANARLLIQPTMYTVLESHIDVSSVNAETAVALIELGFEPDDFYRLHPACYLRHFTLKFLVSEPNAGRRAVLRNELDNRTSTALRLLSGRPDSFGYIETEVYTDAAICAPRPGALSLNFLEAMRTAFSRVRLERREISNNDFSGQKVLPTQTVKAADLHIKFRSPEIHTDSPHAKSLGALLVENGLYEIISEAGNSIYTAQFLAPQYAKGLFEDLRLIVAASNAPVSVCWEPCVSFVRFGTRFLASGERTLPPVPPILLPTGGESQTSHGAGDA